MANHWLPDQNSFLEAVTLQLFFGWQPNLAWLCIVTREIFFCSLEVRKIVMSFDQSQKPFQSLSDPKNLHLVWRHLLLSHLQYEIIMEVLNTCGHVTWKLKISESLRDINQAVRKSKMSFSCTLLPMENPSKLQSPPKLKDDLYYSLQEVGFAKNDQK